MKMFKKAVSTITVLSLLVIVGFWISQHGATNNETNMQFIRDRSYNGKLLDMQNEVSVRDVGDVKWYYDDRDNLVIEYGKVMLKYKTKDFVTPEVQKDLNEIGITTKQHKETLEFTLFYQGEEMTEYVQR